MKSSFVNYKESKHFLLFETINNLHSETRFHVTQKFYFTNSEFYFRL